MLDLNEVAMFVQVARLGSFAKAARHLRMPSVTVSRRIQQLEARLGTRLMQRPTRKLSLTSAGLSFHERCGPAVEKLMETVHVGPTPRWLREPSSELLSRGARSSMAEPRVVVPLTTVRLRSRTPCSTLSMTVDSSRLA